MTDARINPYNWELAGNGPVRSGKSLPHPIRHYDCCLCVAAPYPQSAGLKDGDRKEATENSYPFWYQQQ